MNKPFLKHYVLLAMLALQTMSLPALQSSTESTPSESIHPMLPIKKDGKYYYNEQDKHVHIDLSRALAFLTRKLPKLWYNKIKSLFSREKSPDTVNAIDFLQPTQTVPGIGSIEPKIIWIGHATFLIQINGFNILTDPVFGDVKVGPLSLSKRGMPAGVKMEDLPPIHAIVLSHNHSDHMDTTALTTLNETYKPLVFAPKGNKKTLMSMGFDKKRIITRTWWEQVVLTPNDGEPIAISCLPAYHWSIRFSLGSYRTSLWSSWMISSKDTNIYFAGDTAYGPHFKQIAQAFPNIDIALMPIGPTDEGENKHKESHVDALEAVDAFIDLNAHCFIPMHYGTFFAGKSTIEIPVRRLIAYWEEKDALRDKQLLIARCGEQYALAK
ncbi:MAG TPA: MBL fold metallo-hydrolase [Candidatus Babeliales bacterium]|nr:MBL fold metallo-hydrolase [Candidatus Babeliales bacterium]